MAGNIPASDRRRTTALLGAFAAILVVSIIAFPDQAFAASLQGLAVWWKIVFPALLPFLILSEMLLGYGVVHAIGTMLDPIMRSLLKIPGIGGWALAMGGTIGSPAGARATATLRKQGLLSHDEAQRLLAVSHLSSPVFIVTIVGVGFLHSARLGLLLAAIHIAAALTVGITLRLMPRNEPYRDEEELPQPGMHPISIENRNPLPKRILEAMHDAHMKDGRAFGKLLGDSVSSSVQTLMMIGGYMIIFSVLIQIIDITRLIALLQQAAAFLISSDNLRAVVHSSISGILEIHLGTYSFGAQSGLTGAPLAAAVAAILGWGGLSSHAQAKSLAHDTNLRYAPFLTARLLHAVYSYIMTFAVWDAASGWLGAAPSFAIGIAPGSSVSKAGALTYPQPLETLLQLAMIVAIMAAASILLRGISSGRNSNLKR